MSFCCGASMLGTKGTLKHYRTHIHNVPIVFCPVCHRVEVHFRVETEYEILAEYAHSDGALDVDFQDYTEKKKMAHLFDNCVNHASEDPVTIILTQIDLALDLLMVAKDIGDAEWEGQLKRRLGVLVSRKSKLQDRKVLGQ